MQFAISKINRVNAAYFSVTVSVALCLLAAGTPFFDFIAGVNWVYALCLSGLVTLAVGALTLVLLKFESFAGFQQSLRGLAWPRRVASAPAGAVLFVAWGPALDRHHTSMQFSAETLISQEEAGYAD